MRRNLLIIVVFLFASSALSQVPESKWATMDGGKLHYYDTGNAKAKNAIILVHGWAGSADLWKQTFSAYPNYRVLTVDLPGHGKSEAPYTEYTIDRMARAVESVMAAANVKKAVLVGHSMGSVVARRFYGLFPDKTLGMVIVDMPVQAMGTEAEMKSFVDSVTSNFPKSAEGFVDGMIAAINDREMKALIRRTMLSTPKQSAVSSLSQTFAASNWTDAKINVPVLAIAAPSEQWKPSKEHFEKIAPQVEFQLWPGVTHFLHMERPAFFNGQMKGWIIRNDLL